MKPMNSLRRQRGFLFLIFIVTLAVAGTAGTLTIKAIQAQQAPIDNVVSKIESGAPISDQEMNAAISARAQQFRIAGAGGNIINAVDVAPNAGSVVSSYAGGVISNHVDRASNPIPSSSATLPTDVAAATTVGSATGTWSGTWSWSGPGSNGCAMNDGGAFTMTLTQSGTSVSGSINKAEGIQWRLNSTCVLDHVETGSGTVSGTLSGTSLKLALEFGLSMTGNGTLSNNALTASIVRTTGGSGSLSLKRQ